MRRYFHFFQPLDVSLPMKICEVFKLGYCKAIISPIMKLERVCKLFSLPIPKGILLKSGVSLISRCRKFLSFEKFMGNILRRLHL
ncbi:hypothetical protein Hanom_Chr12g01147051 [Helianthus anomalus]